MSNQNYSLEIVSHHPQFNNKTLRKYYVDGIETVGVWGNEPFEIRFKNHTWNKVQVKLTLDGTDILTGKPGDTEVSKDMWVVNGYATLTLKAWPETNNGGAQFIFTNADNSVAGHTHGNMTSRGIIAAAVFTEAHVPEPIRVVPMPYIRPRPYGRRRSAFDSRGDYFFGSTSAPIGSSGNPKGLTYESVTYTSNNSGGLRGGTLSYNTVEIAEAPAAAAADIDFEPTKSLESLVSVGAGQHVDQKISYVSGLIKPKFTETVRVKYLWWDDLQAKLRTQTKAEPQPSGFPGDGDRKNIDLKNTPRIGDNTSVSRRAEQQQMFDRF